MENKKDSEIKQKLYPQISSLVTWIVFLATLGMLIMSLIPAVFPALLVRTFGGFEDFLGINSFDLGTFAIPLIVTNVIVFSLLVLYYKNKLGPLSKLIKFIFNFEVSKEIAFFVVAILIGLYITFSIGELTNGEFQEDFFGHFKPWLELYSITDIQTTPVGYHLQLLLENISLDVFDNYKVIPFIASISLLVLTYFITVELTKKRFAGIVAMVLVMQSSVFLLYDTSVAYPNFWILFYLLSLYLILKAWPLSPISYVASIFSKMLTVAFMPMTIFFLYRANISIKRKILVLMSYAIIILIGVIFLSGSNDPLDFLGYLDTHRFWDGFAGTYFSLRYDGIVLAFLLPLTIGLFIAARKKIRYADAVMFLILGMLLSAPLVHGFSEIINVPYRSIPLIVFFAMGVGVLLSKTKSVELTPNEQ